MNFVKSLILISSFVIGARAFAASSPQCTYNEWSGELVGDYEASTMKGARGWAPLTLTLCQDAKGPYIILGYNAVGLGLLRDLPERAVAEDAKIQGTDKVAKLIGSYDERDAYKALDSSPQVDAVVFFGDSKSQIMVFRKQFDRVLSNTLILKSDTTGAATK